MKVCSAISAADSGQCELAAGHAGPHERHRAAPGQPPPKRPVRWGSREEWAHVRQAQRRRKGVYVTLSDEARERLAERAKEHPAGTQSAVVEDLILAAR